MHKLLNSYHLVDQCIPILSSCHSLKSARWREIVWSLLLLILLLILYIASHNRNPLHVNGKLVFHFDSSTMAPPLLHQPTWRTDLVVRSKSPLATSPSRSIDRMPFSGSCDWISYIGATGYFLALLNLNERGVEVTREKQILWSIWNLCSDINLLYALFLCL